jgi:tRNA threonylcarbamoyladenosine biosynthesis protein TsaB
MSLILSIETATRSCSAALHKNGELIAERELNIDKSHSRFLVPLIQELFQQSGKKWEQLAAVAISRGPGSYTGLRIGTSTAKGICYALDIPLLSVNTLLSMSYLGNQHNEKGYRLCPMLDARRMEVYAMITDSQLTVMRRTQAIIIDEKSFKEELDEFPVLFFGEGMIKARPVLEKHPNAFFLENIIPQARAIGELALEKYRNQDFENLPAFEPFYLKDFIATIPQKKI